MSTTIKPFAFVVFLIATLNSCTNDSSNKLVLQSNYQLIQDVISVADCTSPFGKYTTEVHSFKDGQCYFKQVFHDSDRPFMVKVNSQNQGSVVTENDSTISTLSPQDVEMIRGHELHKMHIVPDAFFNNLQYTEPIRYQNVDCLLFRGQDNLNNPVSLIYDSDTKLIKKIELLNSRDTTQIIEILYKNWIDSEFGKLASESVIVQAKKDTFNFKFSSLKIIDSTGSTRLIIKT